MPDSERAGQLPPVVMEDAHGGTRHYALNKLDPKEDYMKVNTAEGQQTPAKTVGKERVSKQASGSLTTVGPS
jgi:hypothetical protein